MIRTARSVFAVPAGAPGRGENPYPKSYPSTSGFKTVRMVFSGKHVVRIEAHRAPTFLNHVYEPGAAGTTNAATEPGAEVPAVLHAS